MIALGLAASAASILASALGHGRLGLLLAIVATLLFLGAFLATRPARPGSRRDARDRNRARRW